MKSSKRTFVFCSSCPDAWGGSEEMWNGVALHFARAGCRVSVVKTLVKDDHPNILALKQVCDHIEDYLRHDDIPITLRLLRRVAVNHWLPPPPDFRLKWLCKFLRRTNPDLVVISQGDNFDGLQYAEACQRCDIRYVILAQKASDEKWPSDETRVTMRNAYENAERSFFVSEHARTLTEMQIAVKLSNAALLRNPCRTPITEPLPWPENSDGLFRLACVARLFVLEKGQDVLLRVLAQDKWRERPIEVSIYGQGMHAEGIRGMAEFLGMKNVRFLGFTNDLIELWRKHHALLLPSRCEGIPLTLLEAMLCGRPGIVTNVGGMAEVVEDNRTGFIASAPNVQEFDEALERAWQRRDEWREIGQLASQKVKELMPSDPCARLASELAELCAS